MRLITLSVLFSVVVSSACRATIPATDTVKPGVDLTMSGPGFRNYHCGTTECSDTPDLLGGSGAYDTETIRIPEETLGDEILTIAATVGDDGGVKAAGLSVFGQENRDYQVVEREPGSEVRDIDSSHKQIWVYGDAAAPRTVLGLTVKLRLIASSSGISVTGSGLDFGGSSGRSNANDTRTTNFAIWHHVP